MNTRHASEIWGTHTYFWEEIDITNSNTPTHICIQQSGRDGAGIRERADLNLRGRGDRYTNSVS